MLRDADGILVPGGIGSRGTEGKTEIVERHRHRYEVNPVYIKPIEEKGMIFSGTNGDLMEICEIAEHPFFFGSQFHPEMKSRPGKPSPPFLAFVEAMKEK